MPHLMHRDHFRKTWRPHWAQMESSSFLAARYRGAASACPWRLPWLASRPGGALLRSSCIFSGRCPGSWSAALFPRCLGFLAFCPSFPASVPGVFLLAAFLTCCSEVDGDEVSFACVFVFLCFPSGLPWWRLPCFGCRPPVAVAPAGAPARPAAALAGWQLRGWPRPPKAPGRLPHRAAGWSVAVYP